MKKLRDLGSRKDRNILKLKIDKVMADNAVKENGQFFTLKILNFFSPRPFSFTISVGKKGFINPFFKLLDSLNKNAEMS
jgi:hypothetical protein